MKQKNKLSRFCWRLAYQCISGFSSTFSCTFSSLKPSLGKVQDVRHEGEGIQIRNIMMLLKCFTMTSPGKLAKILCGEAPILWLVLFRDSLLPRPENGPEPRREKRETLPFPAWVQAHFQGGARGSPGTGLVADQQFSLKKMVCFGCSFLVAQKNWFCLLLFFKSEGTGFENLKNLHAMFSLYFDVGP